MRRMNREINIFNISMLDVICSALGAILILFLVSLQSQGKSQNHSENWQERYQQLEEKIKAANDATKTRQQELERQKKALEDQKRALEEQKKALEDQTSRNNALEEKIEEIEKEKKKLQEEANRGSSIGTCEVTVDRVRIGVLDYGHIDDDRVRLDFNDAVLDPNLKIPPPFNPRWFTVDLKPGGNYLVIKALDQGRIGLNTAQVVINPCYEDGESEDFDWRLKTGQVRNLSIVRK